MKHNRGGFLVAVLLLVIAVAVAGIVYYVLRITQTGVFRAEHRIGRAGHADAADHAELQQDPAAAGRG